MVDGTTAGKRSYNMEFKSVNSDKNSNCSTNTSRAIDPASTDIIKRTAIAEGKKKSQQYRRPEGVQPAMYIYKEPSINNEQSPISTTGDTSANNNNDNSHQRHQVVRKEKKSKM